MMEPMPPSLASHPDVLWLIILGLIALFSLVLHAFGVLIMFFGRRTLDRLEKTLSAIQQKQDGAVLSHGLCREGLLKEIEKKVDWDTFNGHVHAEKGAGGVIR
jgi:hypothetical protein